MGAENQVPQQALVQRAVRGIHGQTIAAGLIGVLVAAILMGIGFIAGVMWKPMSPTGQTERFNFISAPLQNNSDFAGVCLWRLNRATGKAELLVGRWNMVTVLRESATSPSSDTSWSTGNPLFDAVEHSTRGHVIP